MDQRKRVKDTLSAVSQWHAQAYSTLDKTRNARCTPDDSPSSLYLPLLSFYLDHSIMVLNAQGLRDLMAIDQTGGSAELLDMSAKNFTVASRLLQTTLHDDLLLDLKVGIHNNQLIIVSHAVTEVIYVRSLPSCSTCSISPPLLSLSNPPGHPTRRPLHGTGRAGGRARARRARPL